MLLARDTDRYLPNDAALDPEFPSEGGALVKLRTDKLVVAGATLRQPGRQERDGVELAVHPTRRSPRGQGTSVGFRLSGYDSVGHERRLRGLGAARSAVTTRRRSVDHLG